MSAEQAWADGAMTQPRCPCTAKMMKTILDVIIEQSEPPPNGCSWCHNYVKKTNNRATPPVGKDAACQHISDLIAADKVHLSWMGERSAPCKQVRPYCCPCFARPT